MQWTWDERKARANRTKHGIGFDVAALIFDDPWQLSELDPHLDDDRWRTIGMADDLVLMVVHTLIEVDGSARIISARKATKVERRRYEQERH